MHELHSHIPFPKSHGQTQRLMEGGARLPLPVVSCLWQKMGKIRSRKGVPSSPVSDNRVVCGMNILRSLGIS